MNDKNIIKAAEICLGRKDCKGCPFQNFDGTRQCRWTFAQYIIDHAGDTQEDPLLKRFHAAPAGTATRELVSALIEANPGKVKMEIAL